MKNTCLLLVLTLLFSACESISFERIEDVSGDYQGIATSISKKRVHANGTVNITTLLDTTFTDQILVETVERKMRSYIIDRKSREHLRTTYDVGSGSQEHPYILNEQFKWGGYYEYDSRWEYEIQFFPEKDSVYAYMLVDDKFGLEEIDSLGNYTTTYYHWEYEFQGKR